QFEAVHDDVEHLVVLGLKIECIFLAVLLENSRDDVLSVCRENCAGCKRVRLANQIIHLGHDRPDRPKLYASVGELLYKAELHQVGEANQVRAADPAKLVLDERRLAVASAIYPDPDFGDGNVKEPS